MSQNIDYVLANTDQIAKDLGERLARLRLCLNVSQEELARKAGLNRRTLSRLESGQGGTLDTLIRVMRGLGLADHLQALLPNPEIQPIQRLDKQRQPRQRARRTVADKAAPWTWGEDETP